MCVPQPTRRRLHRCSGGRQARSSAAPQALNFRSEQGASQSASDLKLRAERSQQHHGEFVHSTRELAYAAKHVQRVRHAVGSKSASTGSALRMHKLSPLQEHLVELLTREHGRVSDLFRKLDTDQDGKISRNEFNAATSMLGLTAAWGETVSQRKCATAAHPRPNTRAAAMPAAA